MMADKTTLPHPDAALPGRATPILEAKTQHTVFDRPVMAAVPSGHEEIFFGMGCFWGAERKFWQTPGVWLTAVGYQGGVTPHPTYDEVCTGRTGHAEVVRVVFDPKTVSLEALLQLFWENHDPTQGMRQGNDVGSQYRSTVFTTTPDQARLAAETKALYQARLNHGGLGEITTAIDEAPAFYYAEAEHQQYLDKNPGGYCGLGGTGISCPTGVGV